MCFGAFIIGGGMLENRSGVFRRAEMAASGGVVHSVEDQKAWDRVLSAEPHRNESY